MIFLPLVLFVALAIAVPMNATQRAAIEAIISVLNEDNRVLRLLPSATPTDCPISQPGDGMITCDQTGNIQIFHAYLKGLRGNLSSTDWSAFTEINYINLAQNQLYGTLPTSFGRLASLQYLYVQRNSLHGPIKPTITPALRGTLLACTLVSLPILQEFNCFSEALDHDLVMCGGNATAPASSCLQPQLSSLYYTTVASPTTTPTPTTTTTAATTKSPTPAPVSFSTTAAAATTTTVVIGGSTLPPRMFTNAPTPGPGATDGETQSAESTSATLPDEPSGVDSSSSSSSSSSTSGNGGGDNMLSDVTVPQSSDDNTATIVGVVVGVIAVLCLGVGVVLLIWYKHRRGRGQHANRDNHGKRILDDFDNNPIENDLANDDPDNVYSDDDDETEDAESSDMKLATMPMSTGNGNRERAVDHGPNYMSLPKGALLPEPLATTGNVNYGQPSGMSLLPQQPARYDRVPPTNKRESARYEAVGDKFN